MKLIIHRLIAFLTLSFLSLFCSYSFAKVYEYNLKNGLKVLVKPVHKAPVASIQLWYKVGSSYEHTGISGISHMLEHVMFKGTPNNPGQSFSNTVASLGGNQNAFTSRDYTTYYQNIAKQHVEKIIALEADRMKSISWDEDEFLKERLVVAEERRLRTDDKPASLLYELHSMQAFTINPNRLPVIGWMNDIQNYQIQDAQDWYEKWYRPNNSTLVVVGDIAPQQIFTWVKKYYGKIKALATPTIKPRQEYVAKVQKINHLSIKDRNPRSLMSFYVPSLVSLKSANKLDKDAYALMVLASILDGGASSRLPTDLIRNRELARSVNVSYNPYSIHAGLFTFSTVSNGKATLAQVEQEILKHIYRIQKRPPCKAELNRVVSLEKAAHVFQQDSLFYQGYQLGALESIGLGWQAEDDYLKKLFQVTAKDVQQVAKKYFTQHPNVISRLNDKKFNLCSKN